MYKRANYLTIFQKIYKHENKTSNLKWSVNLGLITPANYKFNVQKNADNRGAVFFSTKTKNSTKCTLFQSLFCLHNTLINKRISLHCAFAMKLYGKKLQKFFFLQKKTKEGNFFIHLLQVNKKNEF